MSKKMEQKSLKIKEDDKFFNRLMSKDLTLSSSNTSSRHYYVGASSAVPFTWESRPGTPKHVIFSDNSSLVPPLTPPPSYNSKKSLRQLMKNNTKKESKIPWLTNFIFSSPPPSTLSNTSSSSSNCSASSSRSSSWSSSSIKSKNHHHCHLRRRYPCFSSRSGELVHDYNDDDDDEEEEEEVRHQQIGSSSAFGLSPNSSTLCFGVTNNRKMIVMNGHNRLRNIKSALFSITGRRSA